ncbi:MAG: RNA polymerase sigma factor [Marinifilaceae bacterium]
MNGVDLKGKTDYEIIEIAMKGEERAYEELFRRYNRSVYYMILRMHANATDAEDILFETFEKAFARIHTYVPQYAFSTWIFKIASNTAIDFVRRRKMVLVSLDDSENDDYGKIINLPSKGLTPAENAILNERNATIRAKIGRLERQYGELLELRYYSEMTYEEIAKKLSIPLGTVKGRIHRAKEMLAVSLKCNEMT